MIIMAVSSLGWDCLCVSMRFPHSTQYAISDLQVFYFLIGLFELLFSLQFQFKFKQKCKHAVDNQPTAVRRPLQICLDAPSCATCRYFFLIHLLFCFCHHQKLSPKLCHQNCHQKCHQTVSPLCFRIFRQGKETPKLSQ